MTSKLQSRFTALQFPQASGNVFWFSVDINGSAGMLAHLSAVTVGRGYSGEFFKQLSVPYSTETARLRSLLTSGESFPKHLFGTLDGLRGVAALAVVIYHFAARADLPGVMPRGYLAVDFFFVLSGFVVAHAYTQRLQTGSGVGHFILRRLIRLLPALLPGVLIGALLEIGRPNIVDATSHFWDVVRATALGSLAIPWPFATSLEQTIFPTNGPVWTSFLEISANIAFALAIRGRAAPVSFMAFAAMGAAGIVTLTFISGRIDFGSRLSDWPGGFPRVLYSFFAGALLNDLHRRFPGARVPATPVWIYPCVLLLVFAVPVSATATDAIIDLGCVLAVFPVLICSAANSEASPGLTPVFDAAGKLSYPVYAVHYPIVRGVCFVLLHHPVSAAARFGVLAGTIIGITVLGWMIFHLYDQPLRRALVRRFLPVRAAERTHAKIAAQP